MILGLLRRRRTAREAAQSQIRQAVDRVVAGCGGDLDAAFWRTHERTFDPASTPREQRKWRALLEEVDRRRPAAHPRADTATRMLFRNRNG